MKQKPLKFLSLFYVAGSHNCMGEEGAVAGVSQSGDEGLNQPYLCIEAGEYDWSVQPPTLGNA